jgi:hypothetical protein
MNRRQLLITFGLLPFARLIPKQKSYTSRLVDLAKTVMARNRFNDPRWDVIGKLHQIMVRQFNEAKLLKAASPPN